MGQKELLDVTQAGDLEYLWLLLNHLPAVAMATGRKGSEEGQQPEGAESGDSPSPPGNKR